eukprot:TRINITY_DN2223_c0_g2_i1.p1 TRINITY_DN2223_c0_g2~~TRINITY_DN2223_c0_g2_i1.p1  ORF type:complete len:470 (-),score=96.40 TRINITY_DN2223_c0_g2_i1:62-1450(-)
MFHRNLFVLFLSLVCVYCKFAQDEYLIYKKLNLLGDSSNYQTFYQTTDHFDPLNDKKFSQRYCSNWSYFKTNYQNPSPIILYISGEAPMRANTCLNGEKITLAKKFNGVIFSLEHRYYGESLPVDNFTLNSLKYLTSQQAQEDLVHFVSTMIVVYSLPRDTPVIIVGGSYAGAMSSWMRAKYPHLITMSWASSGPVHATENFYQYDSFIAKTAGENCSSALREVYKYIETELYASDDRNKAVRTQFKGGEYIDTDPVRFLYIMADIAAFAIQYNYTEHLCPTITSKDAFNGFVEYSEWLFNFFSQDCRDYDLYRPGVEVDNLKAWLWQSCNEFGFWQVAADDGVRSKKIDITWHRKMCKDNFPNIPFNPHINYTNRYYGSLYTGASKIVFTNGDRDPWRALSLTELHKFEENNNIHSYLIHNSAHCGDLHDPKPDDNESMKSVRQSAENYMEQWLNEYYQLH